MGRTDRLLSDVQSCPSDCCAPKPRCFGCSLKETHGRFACYWNAVNHSSGHVWQGRYYSCPMGETHLWEALRYVELSSVRISLVASPQDWHWSSAAAHCGTGPAASWLDMNAWQERWAFGEWRDYLHRAQDESSRRSIRESTYSGRPLGPAEFTRMLERQARRLLTRQKPGPKKRSERTAERAGFSFDPF
jgi:putative transposase